MDSNSVLKPTRLDDFLIELLEEVSNPIHKRLVKAYQGNNPVESMESELGQILLEVIHRENS